MKRERLNDLAGRELLEGGAWRVCGRHDEAFSDFPVDGAPDRRTQHIIAIDRRTTIGFNCRVYFPELRCRVSRKDGARAFPRSVPMRS